MELAELEALLRRDLDAKHAARETSLALSRELIRTCSIAIRAVHRQEFDRAEAFLANAERATRSLMADLQSHPDIYWTGYVQDALKEYAEAKVTFSLVRGNSLPSPAELGVPAAAYLNGVGEGVGELRRYVLDCLRRDEIELCEPVLALMDDLYGLMAGMDYPDAITGGLRRTTDSVRGIVERTRGDLTLALQQEKLERHLERAEGRLAELSGQ